MELTGILRHLDSWPEVTPELSRIAQEVGAKYGREFTLYEATDILAYTIRKCELNGKGKDYVPILFRTELKDSLTRGAINFLGETNYRNRI